MWPASPTDAMESARFRVIDAGFRGLPFVSAIIVVTTVGSLTVVAQGPNTVSPALYEGLSWRCAGPFDGGPVASVQGMPGEPGTYVLTTPSGGAWRTKDGGETWASIDASGAAPMPGDPHRWVDPANPRRIARTEAQGIAVSLDGGDSWTEAHQLPIAVVAHLTSRSHPTEPATLGRRIGGTPVTVSIADPARSGLIFAGTTTAVYVSFDSGVRWASLQLNMPSVAINDLDIRGNDLVAATEGRSIWTLDDISPLRQLSAANASAAAILFKPEDAVLTKLGTATDLTPTGVHLDYYLGPSLSGAVTLEVVDATDRVVHAATSAASDASDRWLPVVRPLAATPGHHREVWNLHFDPPPLPQYRFAQLARTLFEETPADPDGPRILAGTYRVKLTVGGHTYTQPLVVRDDARTTTAELHTARLQFDLALQVFDAIEAAHRGFLQLANARTQIRPWLTSPDQDLATAAGDLDARLAPLDGSDWTGLILPDADEPGAADAGEEEEEGGKHPDFVPPQPVSLTKDYDDPTSILGRAFTNVEHAPAFATLATKLGGALRKVAGSDTAPDALQIETYTHSCQQLAGVLEAWRTINAQDVPLLNAELAKRHLSPLPIAGSVPAITCTSAGR